MVRRCALSSPFGRVSFTIRPNRLLIEEHVVRIATTSTLVMAATAAGIVAAVLAYQGSSASAQTRNESSATSARPAPSAPTTKWLPCESGWTERHGACIRVKHKVVVVEVTPPAPQAPPAAVRVASSSAGGQTRATSATQSQAGPAGHEDNAPAPSAAPTAAGTPSPFQEPAGHDGPEPGDH